MYTPAYDTTIQTQTSTTRIDTVHTKFVDWDYPFDAPENTSTWCCNDEQKAARIAEYKAWLKLIEDNPEKAWASNYGGWPRIWHKVLGTGMASCWPYWTPRPTVWVVGTLGTEKIDWASLTGAELRD